MAANSFPRYRVVADEATIKFASDETESIAVSLQVHCSVELEEEAVEKGKLRILGMTSILTCTSSLHFVDYRRIPYVIV
jgi:hypothetical protein